MKKFQTKTLQKLAKETKLKNECHAYPPTLEAISGVRIGGMQLHLSFDKVSVVIDQVETRE